LKLLPRILPTEEEEERRLDEPVTFDEGPSASEPEGVAWRWTAAVAAAAAVPRLLYLFVFSDPQNPGPYGDVFHHWQIAYLTKEIGLSAPGGPRLWDLKGLEYIWGALHPLLMVAVFDVTGSIDIVLDRLVSLVFGVLAVVLLFNLCHRLWGYHVALGAAGFAILLPTSILNDASGMVEPLGVALSLLGIWAWTRRRGAQAGIFWGLATMARAEAWIFGLGMVLAGLLRKSGRQLPMVVAFGAIVLVYMKVLLDQTGNPIYPLWWNFFATALGQWQPATISASQASVRPELAALLVAGIGGLAWSLWKRPPSYMLLTFGFGYWVFVAGMFGFTAFLSTWVWWVPLSRRFEFPVLFGALLLVVALLSWVPRRFPSFPIGLGWVIVVAALIGVQALWFPIQQVFAPTEVTWNQTLNEGRQLGAWYNQPPYVGHSLAVPADRPDITYVLARFGGVEGKHLVSEMYDPFAYLPAGYQYADHQSTVNTLVACWLADTDTRLIAVGAGNENYALMLQYNPGWFVQLGSMADAGWTVEGVTAPRPTAAECKAARSAIR
jgi:hypothetical protein